MKGLIIPMLKVAIVRFFLLICFSGGCAVSNVKDHLKEERIAYDLLKHMEYGKGVLSRQTLSFEDLKQKGDSWLFNFEEINVRNYNKNWVTENKPFVNFDTIFSKGQILSINENFKRLKKIKLRPQELTYPRLLTKNGQIVITFPIIQQGKTGEYYGFFAEYTSPESTLFIFKRTSSGWEEVAKVALGVS